MDEATDLRVEAEEVHELCYTGPAQTVPSGNVGAVLNVTTVQEPLKLLGQEKELDHLGAL